MTKRTDIHRPSAINPDDYVFVAVKYIGCKELDPFEVIANAEAMKTIRGHIEKTGGRYSSHEHGGTCFICGAFALYLAVYYHPATNKYIECGEECADKMDFCDVDAFNPLRRAVRDAREAKAGKMKAELTLREAGLERAWGLFNMSGEDLADCGAAVAGPAWDSINGLDESRTVYRPTWEYTTLCDIVGKLVRYGSISEKQTAFLAKLLDKIDRRPEIEAARKAEKDAAEPCPSGRVEVTGTVLKTEVRETAYGDTLKMLVKADGGYLVWGTVPAALELFDVPVEDEGHKWSEQRGLVKGDRIAFTATLEQSDRDEKFGFFKRPSKARMVEMAKEERESVKS